MNKIIGIAIISLISIIIFKTNDGLISIKNAKDKLKADYFNIILDVRSKEEFDEGKYKNAINIPFDNISKDILNKFDTNDKILLYCRSGRRAKIAYENLKKLGYKRVYFINDTYKSLL
jgi:rhodanese-related sulfurtransferase